eukprot:SAG22_NODE_17302_length_307_cov_0.990385_2_plen_40_part_01
MRGGWWRGSWRPVVLSAVVVAVISISAADSLKMTAVQAPY